MRKIFLFFAALLSTTAYAQRIDKPNEPYDVFCYISLNGIRSETAKITTSIDYGKDNYRDCYLCDENDTRIVFCNIFDCVEYMSKRGWQVVNDIGTSSVTMRKSITSDKEAYEHLNIKLDKDTKKK